MKRVWSDEAILEAIKSFYVEFGRPPAVNDWNPAKAARLGHWERRALYQQRRVDWPHASVVQRAFGSWSAAIEAAGLQPRERGKPRGMNAEIAAEIYH